ncbi:MAG: glycosyltransferase [Candidatus Hydrogenedentes bacterium]|nr:glycosyltransferase [Candidatus Hydrogenedentota bacterium]
MSTITTIIIPAFNQLEYCRQCVSSILAYTTAPYKLVLVDNGSTDGVGVYFDSVPGAVVVHAERNLGFAAGVNLGLAHREGHALLLNSDTIVSPGWLEGLIAPLDEDPGIGAVGPMSNYVSGVQLLPGLDFKHIDEIHAYAAQCAEAHAGQRLEVNRLVGFCLLIRDTVADAVGDLDGQYGIGNYEDDDYCMRVQRAGHRLVVARDAFVFHYGSRTFLAMGYVNEAWEGLLQENQRRFREKWQIAPDEKADAIQRSLELNRRAQRLIEGGDVKGALAALKEAMEMAPTLEQNYNDVGVIQWTLGRHEDALENFRRALRLNPGHEAARENYIGAAETLGTAEAAVAFVRALDAASNAVSGKET